MKCQFEYTCIFNEPVWYLQVIDSIYQQHCLNILEDFRLFSS